MLRTGRRPGPSTTRSQIVEAAAESFSSNGYQGTSLRQVARDAGVDPALVRRFFGDKEQLFSAVVAAVFRPDETVALLLKGPRGKVGERLARHILDLLGDVDDPGPLLGVMRSAAASEPAAAVIREFLAEQMLGRVTEAMAVEQAKLRAALAASQLVGLAIARYAVKVDAMVSAEADELIPWIAPALQRYLTGRAPA